VAANRFRDHIFAQTQRRTSAAGRFQFVNHSTQEIGGIGDFKKSGQGIDPKTVGAETFDSDPHFLQSRDIAFDPFGVARWQGKNLRQKYSLRWNSLLLHPPAQFFEQNALMRGMLINENEPIGIFHQNIKSIEYTDDLKLLIVFG